MRPSYGALQASYYRLSSFLQIYHVITDANNIKTLEVYVSRLIGQIICAVVELHFKWLASHICKLQYQE